MITLNFRDGTNRACAAKTLRAAVELEKANLSGANLSESNLSGANLSGADLSGVLRGNLMAARLSIVPESGSFLGWKLCRNGILISVRIPAEAPRSNATGRKCRAAYVDVLEVVGAEYGVSLHDSTVLYRQGERVHCHLWNADRWTECDGGIHFYLTRIEAENHT